MIEYEELQKSLKKKMLNDKLLRYGTPFIQRNEMRFAEGWEEGEEIMRVKQHLVSVVVT